MYIYEKEINQKIFLTFHTLIFQNKGQARKKTFVFENISYLSYCIYQSNISTTYFSSNIQSPTIQIPLFSSCAPDNNHRRNLSCN